MFYTLQSAFKGLNANVSDNELGGEYYLQFTYEKTETQRINFERFQKAAKQPKSTLKLSRS